MASFITYRDCDGDDSRAFTQMLNNCGGVPLYRAIFGQFTYSAILEYSLATYGAFEGEDDFRICHSMVALNDCASSTADQDSFVSVINELKPYINVEVRAISFSPWSGFCVNRLFYVGLKYVVR
jgi:hypothetical protein